ncbi:MAG: DNA polymerase III subunit gamma/tau [Nitrosomonadales bacterium]|jgi:DNA polymerase-3 subunit gamma/tau|nr:DNA polymerase III subunit gamma/tau [Nitrosomonadales bacterium]
MSHQVLARKWRPKNFDTLVGQENTVQALINALDQERLHHAYLFTGTRGVGKTTLARILAKSLNCEKGISSKPCGECSSCLAVDKGNFVDLIEVDAASNTKVDEMRELLENSQYAPTSGRFKVYIIDEVHMLSNSAFNAMLKTLEEPPEHIKFILATTDPKKVPVTVLSRCLQFNLKQMVIEKISSHLDMILTEEKIKYEKKALGLIAKSAKGSMRDALSILDQAIAYSGNEISEQKISEMLGIVDNDFLTNILYKLADNKGDELIKISCEMNNKNIALDSTLDDLARLIHEVSVYQVAPSKSQGFLDDDEIKKLSKLYTAETLQLLYQIVINGKKDIYLAPDLLTGFNTTLLRMLAFFPSMQSEKIESKIPERKIESTSKASLEKKNSQAQIKGELKDPQEFDGDWHELVKNLKLGIANSLAQECEFKTYQNYIFELTLDSNKSHLMQENYIKKLEESIINHFNKKIKVKILVDQVKETPAIKSSDEKSKLLKETESAMMKDGFVKDLIENFDAQVVPTSIEPINNKGK